MDKLFSITTHAIEQFIRRWEPSKNSWDAEEELDALLRTSKSVGKTILGHAIMVSGHRPEIRMVIKDRNVCVTVLPPDGRTENDPFYDEEIQAAYTSYQEGRAKLFQGRRVEDIEQQITAAYAKVHALDEQRKLLGDQKNELMHEINDLKRDLKQIQKLNPNRE